MGTQQLLLIVLGVIIVGIAIVVGIQMFGASAVEANKNAIVQDALQVAAKAQQWYRKPEVLGGGGRSFENFDLTDIGYTGQDSVETQDGTIIVSGQGSNSFVVTVVGKEDGDGDGNPVRVRMTVYADSTSDAEFSEDGGTTWE